MTQSAHSTGFKVAFNLAGNAATPMWHGLLLSNNTISCGQDARGDILFASAGYLRSAVSRTTDQLPVGVAQTPVTTSVTTNVSMLFFPAAPWVVFTGMYDSTCTQAKIWTFHSISGTRGKMAVDNDAGGKCVWVIGKEARSSFGAYTDVLFTFCQNKFQPTEFDSSHGIAG